VSLAANRRVSFSTFWTDIVFRSVRLNLPRQISSLGWGWNHILVESPTHDWWVATGQGIAWFPAVAQIDQLARISPRLVKFPCSPPRVEISSACFKILWETSG